MDAEMYDLLRTSLERVLNETGTEPLAERLARLGWNEVLADDATGALALLFTVKGELAAGADALSSSLSAWLSHTMGDASLTDATVALDGIDGPSRWTGDGKLAVSAVATGIPTQSVVVSVDRALAVLPADAVDARTTHGVDVGQPLTHLTGTVASAEVRLIEGIDSEAMHCLARRLLCHELVGLAHHVVASAVTYTGARIQYGKPIGTFQALQHRIAAAHTLVVGAAGLVAEADRTQDPWISLVAKAMAGQAAELACTQAQQCYGAIGFTAEHEFHRYLKRMYALDWLAGDWRSTERRIGAALQASGQVPRIGSL